MLRSIVFLFLLSPLLIYAATAERTTTAQPVVTVEQAARLIAEEEHLHIVDVRKLSAYQQGTLPQAVNMGWPQLLALQPETTGTLLIIGTWPKAYRNALSGYKHIWLLPEAGLQDWVKSGRKLWIPPKAVPAFIIPRGLCEMNAPAMRYPAKEQ